MQDHFFDEHQRRTIEAAMARIIPADDLPGAREAGAAEFVDRYLSGIDRIFAKPDGGGFEQLDGKRAGAWRHRIAILRETYVVGVAELDRRSHDRFGERFADLAEDRQDRILTAMERHEAGAEEPAEDALAGAGVTPAMQQTSAEIELGFFPLLALHTRQGFYADPIYGGNKDRAGWRSIGFDGPSSLAETHAGRYTTLPYFSDAPIDWENEAVHGT